MATIVGELDCIVHRLCAQIDAVDASSVGCSAKVLLSELTRCLAECHPCSTKYLRSNATCILCTLTLLCARAIEKRAITQWLQNEATEATLCQALCFSEEASIRTATVKVRIWMGGVCLGALVSPCVPFEGDQQQSALIELVFAYGTAPPTRRCRSCCVTVRSLNPPSWMPSFVVN